jgi:hypothetical protein
MIGLSSIVALRVNLIALHSYDYSVPDAGNAGNTPCSLNLISTFILHGKLILFALKATILESNIT